MLKIGVEVKGIDKALEMVDPKKVKRALRLTMEELGKGIRTQATKEIAGEYNVEQKDLRDFIKVGKATEKEMTLTVTGARPSLTEFGASQTRKGVSFRIKRSGGKGFLPSAFITSIRYGRGVFARQRSGSKRVPRGPVDVFSGPSIPQLFMGKKV